MTTEITPNAEAMKATYSKLTRAWTALAPSYGSEFAQALMSFLKTKMELSVAERTRWFEDELNLNSSRKGNIEYNGTPKVLATSLINTTISYGPADYLSLLNHVATALPDIAPVALTQDIHLAAEYFQVKL